MKPRGTVQLMAWTSPALRERVRSIAKRTKMTYAEVLEFAMARVTDGEFTKSERQPALPFGRK